MYMNMHILYIVWILELEFKDYGLLGWDAV
jgi:hypothetical protein